MSHNLTIEELGLSVRAYSCLKRAGVDSVDDIIRYTEEDLCTIRNLGWCAFTEIKSKINSLGLDFKEY